MNKTPLHKASIYNSYKVRDILILKGADINSTDIIYQKRIKLLLITII